MRAEKRSDDVSAPSAPGWADAEAVTIALRPIALDAQPTEYIREKWAGRPYGTVSEVRVAAAHNGQRLSVRLEWDDSATANGEFPDAGAVYFPTGADAPVDTVGSADAPVRLWHWQADTAGAKNLEGRGPGRFRPVADTALDATADLSDGKWSVVLTGEVTQAQSHRMGVVVWDGSNEERAGLGAVSAQWTQLEIG